MEIEARLQPFVSAIPGTDSTASIAIRGDAPESLIRPIRAIPLQIGALGGGFFDKIQKNFLRRILVDRGPHFATAERRRTRVRSRSLRFAMHARGMQESRISQGFLCIRENLPTKIFGREDVRSA